MKDVEQSPLGKNTLYYSTYTPSLLFPISREEKRKEIEIVGHLPFHGADIWTAMKYPG